MVPEDADPDAMPGSVDVRVEDLVEKLVSLHLVVTCQPLGLEVASQR